ncbi:MAG: alpha/beta fold hydrolase, partial [Chloroflexi bacterium]|nr:alpha/beta fold hydrolase [Chloroflexota bacterium]
TATFFTNCVPPQTFRLAEIGLDCSAAGQTMDFERGGGAVSIISDKAISDDLAAHASETTTFDGGVERPYYSVHPVCKTISTLDGQPARFCAEEAVTHLLKYTTSDSEEKPFHRPRGVAIQPIVVFESPRFGDHVGFGTAVQARWHEDGIERIRFAFLDFDATTGEPSLLGETPEFTLTQEDKDAGTFSNAFGLLFQHATGQQPVEGKLYRIEVRICGVAFTNCDRPADDEDENSFSMTSVDVVFEGAVGGEVLPDVIVFIPGIAGSALLDKNANLVTIPPEFEDLWLGCPSDHHRMSLYPLEGQSVPTFLTPQTQPNTGIISPDVLRIAPCLGLQNLPQPLSSDLDIYGSFIDQIKSQGDYKEYNVNNNPARRTTAGCDTSQIAPGANNKNFFVFAYDWRFDNHVAAVALKDYMGCIKQFHPDSKVTIVAHSMGGLVARRYIIENPNGHNVARLITLGSPFLGAPKGVNVMETGDFGVPVLVAFNSTIKDIAGSLPGAHQLMPSKAYFDLGATHPLGESGVDVDGDGFDVETYSFENMVSVVNQRYGCVEYGLLGGHNFNPCDEDGVKHFDPGTIGRDFHDFPGQDDWRNDTSGVKYFHIYGEQGTDNTIGQTLYKGSGTDITDAEVTIKVKGDGTVPVISAERIGNGLDLNAPNAELFKCTNANDKLADHNGMLKNPDLINLLLKLLGKTDNAHPGCTETPRP